MKIAFFVLPLLILTGGIVLHQRSSNVSSTSNTRVTTKEVAVQPTTVTPFGPKNGDVVQVDPKANEILRLIEKGHANYSGKL
jgi:hypothetical protein